MKGIPLRIEIGPRDLESAQCVMVTRHNRAKTFQPLENLEEIVKIPYIDGFIFGPNDLSGSLGELGNVFGDKTMEQIRRALKIVKENGKYVGLATGDLRPETLRFWSELGIDMMTVGADWNFVFDAAKNTRNLLQKYHLEA